ncbi:MAG: hypothetical protein GY765_09215 [bacterium]|nr:hypothetical protein [bacterium]
MKTADVFIQAGHEGRSSGATGAESQWGSELLWNPVVADEATRLLRAAGIDVIREDAFLDPEKYRVDLALFIHFDGSDSPGASGASIGFDDISDKPAADQWKTLYSKYWPYKWMPDNFTSNLRNYYGYRYTVTSDAEMVFEMGELTHRDQALWLKPRLKWLGSLIAHFVSSRLEKGNIPDPGEFSALENVFTNNTSVVIDPGPANTVISTIDVSGLDNLAVGQLEVALEIDHTWDEDLTITLIGPDSMQVILADRRGGSKDDFKSTVFADQAETSVSDASAPFSGRYKPEGDLADFSSSVANGTWTLQVRDNATHDGGSLNSWSLAMAPRAVVPPVPESQFDLELRFTEGLTESQRVIFQEAAARWREVITGDVPDIEVNGEVIRGVLIEAGSTEIDGRGNILGQAGPTHLRPRTHLPARGIMSFDSFDMDRMETDGVLLGVIIHEMAHVLGFGTIWRRLGLLRGAGSTNPTFIGRGSMREYANLTGAVTPTPVPVANQGGPGTRDSHWRESVLGNELMTGFINRGANPLSRLSVACMEDMGYQVNYEAAEVFIMPTMLRMAEMGVGTESDDHGGYGTTFFPDQQVLPEDALR